MIPSHTLGAYYGSSMGPWESNQSGVHRRQPVDILAHSFGTAVASALLQKLEVGGPFFGAEAWCLPALNGVFHGG